MSESGQPSVGQILRDAREAQGITLEEVTLADMQAVDPCITKDVFSVLSV